MPEAKVLGERIDFLLNSGSPPVNSTSERARRFLAVD